MVPAKKSDSASKPASKSTTAPNPGAHKQSSLHKPDFKAAAAGDKQPTSTPERVTSEPTPATGTQPADAAKVAEKLGKKLRRKDEILAALRAGAKVVHTSAGLYRIVAADGVQNPTSKRRVLALIQQRVLKATENDKRIYVLDVEAEKAASEKKSAPKPESAATTSGNSTAK